VNVIRGVLQGDGSWRITEADWPRTRRRLPKSWEDLIAAGVLERSVAESLFRQVS